MGKGDREARAAAARVTLLGLRYTGLIVKDGVVEPRGQAIPVKGARAAVHVGTPERRTTVTRVALGTVLAPGLGTAVGFMAKKTRDRLYVTITGGDGRQVVSKALPQKHESDIRAWVTQFNSYAAD